MKRILIAPLNWGLGHVTRCIPIIQTLEKLGAEPVLASDGVALHLLRAEFPHLTALELPSYRIRYEKPNMVWNIGRQLPRILYAIRAEHDATERLAREHNIRGIVSDNRYGCFSNHVPSVVLTHQLNLQVPNRGIEWSANKLLRIALSKFNEVWVPDAPEEPRLSGVLSQLSQNHIQTRFIGILSRMQRYDQDQEYDVAVVLSGPEPQRTILEQRLIEQAIGMSSLRFIFIQGKTQAKQHYYASDNVEVVSYLTSRELNDVLLASNAVVCRSGYSSIMDLAVLGKKAILIPTPGQTEQEYLADFLSEKNIFVAQNQSSIDLESGLDTLDYTHGLQPQMFDNQAFVPSLKAWLDEV
ncbi:MAG: glycosyltransferase [Saprospiraceae bacterium]|nr:glycosyltransferase [Saprospiraceae bacterium]